jgi:hypothetical protein
MQRLANPPFHDPQGEIGERSELPQGVILVGANILNDRSSLKAEQGPSLEKAWKLTIGLERRASRHL